MTLQTLPKYETYKNSGIEWLGEIPSDWQLTPLKRVLLLVSEKILSSKSNLSYIGMENVESWSGKLIPSQTDVEGLANRFQKGDILFGKLRPYLAKVSLATDEGICSTEFLVYRTKTQSSNYVRYLLGSKQFINLVDASTYGSKMPRASADFIGVQQIPLPSKQEQTAIAHFLDQKTAQIDAAIAIKEQQIALLKERKQILIQQAVTQGLDPTVPMKESGVEWIGEIPAHWKYTKIKYCIDILPGYAFKSEEYTHNESDIKLLRGINVNPNQIKWDDVVYWSTDKLYGLDKYKLQLGDLVIGMDRPWVSTGIRVAQIQKDDLPSLLLQRVARIRGKNGVLTDYVKQLLSTQLFVSYFEPLLTGISVPHISTDQIEAFECPIPTPSEQEKILAYINDESKKIDEAVMLQKQQIEKLREYKITLINSAVTGKIRVTNNAVDVSI